MTAKAMRVTYCERRFKTSVKPSRILILILTSFAGADEKSLQRKIHSFEEIMGHEKTILK